MSEVEMQIGPYRMTHTLGSGTTSKVKMAEHVETGNIVAIKIIKKKIYKDNPVYSVKIRREIALMKLVDHPHVLGLLDVFESAHHLYIVTEYASQGELFDYIVKNRSLTPPRAAELFRQLIYGVEYLHSFGIIHRDLKTENILLDENANVKIADFGFAKFIKTNIADTSCGSPHYAAPEVIRGIPYDGKAADIWSCGVILHAMAAVCYFFFG